VIFLSFFIYLQQQSMPYKKLKFLYNRNNWNNRETMYNQVVGKGVEKEYNGSQRENYGTFWLEKSAGSP
jgi:hypothetical protein